MANVEVVSKTAANAINYEDEKDRQTSDGYLPPPKSFATQAIHTGQDPEKWDSLSIVPPLVTSTTFKMYPPANIKQHGYGRASNPIRNVLEEVLAKLESAKHCLCFASGLGAMTAIIAMFKAGDGILCSDDIYGGTYRILSNTASNFGIEARFCDFDDLSNIEKSITPKTKLLWIESPTNPLLKVYDLRAIAEIAKRNNILLLIDNTFLTPYFQRPLQLGVDIVLYSLSKYINGHSDVVMGSVAVNDDEMHKKLRYIQESTGIIPSPFDCYQVVRSLKTLKIRMKTHNINGLAVAKFLEKHPKIEKVIHPGLPSHPQHELFKRQTSGHSGAVTCYIKGGLEAAQKILENLKVFTLAKSLGGCESLVAFPALMSHADAMMPKEQREKMNITNNLLRFSVGLEDPEDLIDDLSQALDGI